MLVLTRRLGETIIINDNVRVTVLDVKGDRVRLGIAAPADVLVDRQEVHERRMRFDDPKHVSDPILTGLGERFTDSRSV
jgi:carbon storage regulator